MSSSESSKSGSGIHEHSSSDGRTDVAWQGMAAAWQEMAAQHQESDSSSGSASSETTNEIVAHTFFPHTWEDMVHESSSDSEERDVTMQHLDDTMETESLDGTTETQLSQYSPGYGWDGNDEHYDDSSDSSFEPLPPVSPPATLTFRSRPSYDHDQHRRELNLLNLLPITHIDRLAVTGLRLVPHSVITTRQETCAYCESSGHTRLWRCTQCSMLEHRVPFLCDTCCVASHVNKPHNFQVWNDGECILRAPFASETVIFQLRPYCHHCRKPLTILSLSVVHSSVLLMTPNGAFMCDVPVSSCKCDSCNDCEVTAPKPSDFGCIPCEAVQQSGSTWFSRSLTHQILVLRSEAGNSNHSLAWALHRTWVQEGSFLVNPSGNPGEKSVTVNWHEKKIAEVSTSAILLAHPSWMDTHLCFSLSDQFASKCGACHTECSQVHIDGFFKMKTMRRPKSFRASHLKHFCNVESALVEQLQQADLNGEAMDEQAQCSDLGGNITRFRAGGSTALPGLSGSYSQTGIMTAICPHGVPLRVLPIETKGEKFFLPHAIIHSLENSPMDVKYYSYDVACRLKPYLQNRDTPLSQLVHQKLVLGHFHSKAHKCKKQNVSWSRHGAGLDDGEQGERWNSHMVNHAPSMRYMRPERMLELLEHLMLENTHFTNCRMGEILLKRGRHALKSFHKHHTELMQNIAELESRLSLHEYVISDQTMEEWVASYSMVAADSGDEPDPGSGITAAEQSYVTAHRLWQGHCADINTFQTRLTILNGIVFPTELQMAELAFTKQAISVYNRMTKARAKVSSSCKCVHMSL